MTAQEAVKWHTGNYQDFISCMWEGTEGNPYDEAFGMAIKALEKQVPKQPVCIEDKMWTCPCCGNNLMFKWSRYPDILMPKEAGEAYCMACGQAIDWTVIDLLESGDSDE